MCCPISQTEANHRHLLTELADWAKLNKKPKRTPLPSTSPTTYRYETQNHRTSTNYNTDPTVIYSRTKHRPLFQTDSSRLNNTPSQFRHQQQTPAMPIDTIANACYLGSDMSIRPRNPHTRGTIKYSKRQNINRNVRLHLRNDRKIVQNDLKLTQAVHDAHFVFYCILSSLDTWYHTKQLLPHDRTLIHQWATIYRKGKNVVL
jgi:hypothetical protein